MPEIERAALGAPATAPHAGLGGPPAESSHADLNGAAPQAGLASRPAGATPSTEDSFNLVAAAGRDLLARVDRAIDQIGAPPAHPVYPLLARLGVQPGQALDLFAGVQPARLAELATELRAIAAAYRTELASPLDSASKRLGWGGAGYDAFLRHWRDLIAHLAGEFPEGESMTDRLEISASYVDALAAWYGSGRRALVQALVEVLPTREALTLRGCTALAGGASGEMPNNSGEVAAAAAEIAHRVLSAVADVYDVGVDTFLPGPGSSPQAARWQEHLPALPYRPPARPTTPASSDSSELWIRL